MHVCVCVWHADSSTPHWRLDIDGPSLSPASLKIEAHGEEAVLDIQYGLIQAHRCPQTHATEAWES